MRIGIKLSLYFFNEPAYEKLFDRFDVLDYLVELGFKAVEIPIGPDTEAEALSHCAELCHTRGMHISLHPYSESTNNNPAYFAPEKDNACYQTHERFFSFAKAISELQNEKTIINIHPAAAPGHFSRTLLLDRSTMFFSWAKKWCETHAPLVQPVAELQITPNAAEPVHRIGDNFSELRHIVDQSGVKICWDFGHSFMNAHRFGADLAPSKGALPHVAHVHCHDVSNGKDHQPLVYGTVPWQMFLTQLNDSGFDQTVILEVPASHFLNAGGIETLVKSARSLLAPFATNRRDRLSGCLS